MFSARKLEWKKKGVAFKKGGIVSTHTQTLIRGRLNRWSSFLKLNVSKNGSNSGHACLVDLIIKRVHHHRPVAVKMVKYHSFFAIHRKHTICWYNTDTAIIRSDGPLRWRIQNGLTLLVVAGNLPLFTVAASCENSAASVIYHLLRRNGHDASTWSFIILKK